MYVCRYAYTRTLIYVHTMKYTSTTVAPVLVCFDAPGRGNEIKRYAMFREDVADLAAVSASKLKVYVPVLTMSLGYAAGWNLWWNASWDLDIYILYCTQ